LLRSQSWYKKSWPALPDHTLLYLATFCTGGFVLPSTPCLDLVCSIPLFGTTQQVYRRMLEAFPTIGKKS
jgi:hypothetical protein